MNYTLDRQVNGGAWQEWRVVTGIATAALFEGTPNTVYAWRIRATDRAGNPEAIHPAADITFTTGNDSTGLTKVRLPMVIGGQ